MKSTRTRVGGAMTAIGVIASLAFVALEVRQNTRAVRGATLQAVSQQSFELTMAGLDNPELRAAFSAASNAEPGSLSADHEEILVWFIQSKLRADENRFRQVQLGTLDESTTGQLSSNTVYRFPYFAEFWATRRDGFSPDFREFVEREFLPMSRFPLGQRR